MLRQRLGPPTSLIVATGLVGPGFIPYNRTEISITPSVNADLSVRVCARECYFPDAQRVPEPVRTEVDGSRLRARERHWPSRR
jgi:hypothetical protein